MAAEALERKRQRNITWLGTKRQQNRDRQFSEEKWLRKKKYFGTEIASEQKWLRNRYGLGTELAKMTKGIIDQKLPRMPPKNKCNALSGHEDPTRILIDSVS